MSWKLPLVSAVVGTTLLAGAGTAAADNDFVLDLPELTISLGGVRNDTAKGIDSKYVVRMNGAIIGDVARPDRVVIEWKGGGKTLATIECDASPGDGGASFDCTQPEASALDTYGAVQAVLSLVDDSEDKTHILHTMNLKVGRFWQWYQRGKKTLHYPHYQIMPLDLLGSAIMWHDADRGDANGTLSLQTWGVHGEGEPITGDTLRCSVDGKKVGDFGSGTGYSLVAEATDWRDVNGPKHHVSFRKFAMKVGGVVWGKKETLRAGYAGKDTVLLDEHPGAWSCDWRKSGKVLRTFSFMVADGRILPHAEQAAGLKLPGSESMITVSFPDDVTDLGFDPAALKAGGFYGRPWSDPATGKAMKLGKAKGPIELAPPKGAKGGKPSKK